MIYILQRYSQIIFKKEEKAMLIQISHSIDPGNGLVPHRKQAIIWFIYESFHWGM